MPWQENINIGKSAIDTIMMTKRDIFDFWYREAYRYWNLGVGLEIFFMP
jgi:hypothetical protein